MLCRFWICVCYVDLLQCVGVAPCHWFFPPWVYEWFMLTDELFSSNNHVPPACFVTILDSCGSVGGGIYAPQSCHVQCLLVMSRSHCLKLSLPWATHMPESSCAIWIHEVLHNCVFWNAFLVLWASHLSEVDFALHHSHARIIFLPCEFNKIVHNCVHSDASIVVWSSNSQKPILSCILVM